MQIYLIRHPRPRAVIGLCYGRLDVAVDSKDLANTAIAVRQQIPVQVMRRAPIYTSPLSRCADLARALSAPRDPISVSDLTEMDFGSWEGQSWDTVPRDQLDKWAEDIWCYRPGGGESAQAVADRWHRWVATLLRSESDPVIAVTHAGIIRVVLAQSQRLADADVAQAAVDFGSVHYLHIPDTSPPRIPQSGSIA
jgi:alpha-ribazole phosphatase